MTMKNKLSILISALVLSACANQKPIDDYSHYLRNKNIAAPTLEQFPHCYDYGCKTVKQVSLNESEWQKISALFEPSPQNAEKEREYIALAIQKFEQIIGQKTGTDADKRGTFRLYEDSDPKFDKFQQDCVDESTNTTIYLSLLKQAGLLKYHRITQPQSRQPGFGGNIWWHQSATIKDIETNQQYAVDSWFEDNGAPAYIVPIKTWFRDWKPKRDN